MFASRVTVLFFVRMSWCLIWISFSSSVDVVDVELCTTTTKEVSLLDTRTNFQVLTWWAGSLLWLYTLTHIELILNNWFSSSVIYCFILWRKGIQVNLPLLCSSFSWTGICAAFSTELFERWKPALLFNLTEDLDLGVSDFVCIVLRNVQYCRTSR